MKTIIYVGHLDATYLPRNVDYLFPEWDSKSQQPRTPIQLIGMCPLFFRKTISTSSELIPLYFIQQVELGYMPLEDLCIHRIKVDHDPNNDMHPTVTYPLMRLERHNGSIDFVDKWPHGFFTERGQLLFGCPKQYYHEKDSTQQDEARN